MNRLIVKTSLVLLTSPVWADDEPADIHTCHDVTFGQPIGTQMRGDGNCAHSHIAHTHPDTNIDPFEPDA